jgi:hypothetical protein
VALESIDLLHGTVRHPVYPFSSAVVSGTHDLLLAKSFKD